MALYGSPFVDGCVLRVYRLDIIRGSESAPWLQRYGRNHVRNLGILRAFPKKVWCDAVSRTITTTKIVEDGKKRHKLLLTTAMWSAKNLQ